VGLNIFELDCFNNRKRMPKMKIVKKGINSVDKFAKYLEEILKLNRRGGKQRNIRQFMRMYQILHVLPIRMVIEN